MSWQDYVDKQLIASQCVTRAFIAGQDGNVWAKSDGFEVRSLFSVSLSWRRAEQRLEVPNANLLVECNRFTPPLP